MTEQKFKIGEMVYFRPKNLEHPSDAQPGPYQILRRLPATEEGEFQYRIRSTFENHERVATESELFRV